ncbi:MAG: 4Fe-4S dicluster domain-containing protein [Chitinispirillia bacterium]
MKEKYQYCYQCKKCSAGCPISSEMDIHPHQIMHYLSLGMVDKVLKSKTIWLCAGCYTCAMRCPNDINITSVMTELREKAFKQGIAPAEPEIKKFHVSFMNSFKNSGRVHELRMMLEYNLRTGKPFQNAKLGPRMLIKGKLKVIPPKSIRGFKKYMRDLWK